MPKPDLVALTGGYRKTPVLQQGNHIYCDTRLIARVIDNQSPHESVYPEALSLTANTIAQWADQQLFSIAVALAFSPAGFAAFSQGVPEKFVDAFLIERAKMREGATGLSMEADTALALLTIYLQQMNQQLQKKGPYLCGEPLTIADLSVYHCLWFINNNDGVRPLLEGYEQIQTWQKTMSSIGHGSTTMLDAEAAINIAKSADKAVFSNEDFVTVGAIAQGTEVSITPTDYGIVPVVGELVVSKVDELAIKRIDERAGEVYVHFPRLGYKVTPQ